MWDFVCPPPYATEVWTVDGKRYIEQELPSDLLKLEENKVVALTCEAKEINFQREKNERGRKAAMGHGE